MVSVQQRRETAEELIENKVKTTRSCTLVEINRSSLAYKKHPRDDSETRQEIKRHAEKKKRQGCLKVWSLIRKEGKIVNKKKVHRIWKEEKLQVPRKKKRKRLWKGAVPCAAEYPNHVWTYDFMYDRCYRGRKLKILTVIDEFTRHSMCIKASRSIKAKDIKEILQQLFLMQGKPAYLRSDNGPEFIQKDLKNWLDNSEKVTPMHIEPGSPWQNAFGESFNSVVRDECLNMEVFLGVLEANIILENYRTQYNTERPHGSLGYLTPVEFRMLYDSGALPPNPRSLPHSCCPMGEEKEKWVKPSTSPIGITAVSALRLLSSIALSSDRHDNSTIAV